MLLIKTLSFAAVAVAFHPDLAELFPRQTAVNNGDPCYTKVQSLYDSQPTLGPAYSSWASSIYATVTDNCTAFEITGTALSVVASWRDEMGDWRVSHSSEIRSLSSECSSYMKSRADAALASGVLPGQNAIINENPLSDHYTWIIVHYVQLGVYSF
ncbi:unnamed protein product [Clonostachys chloroleuca]|uniref:Ecp2 effector protein domain-containing protein n=1 Tax=Clonostachys chloroleuca TaxID=1926264 RepID=A0AA35M9P6_9HYPO|nr:unnamed protein product [Clonostachys chloroleuca]